LAKGFDDCGSSSACLGFVFKDSAVVEALAVVPPLRYMEWMKQRRGREMPYELNATRMDGKSLPLNHSYTWR